MTFLTPCFVRVEDTAEREKLVDWCVKLGYYYVDTPVEERNADKVVCDEHCVGISHDPQYFTNTECTDCGSNIGIFKALAAMNDENDLEQWFIEGGRMFKCNSKKLNNYSYHALYTRKATADEIVEYFKTREK